MALEPFLAMTAAEITGNRPLPPKLAWMACHFSPYGPGLSNLPKALPPGSLLMVDDVTPMGSHDPQTIRDQVCRCTEVFDCFGILLDFQRPGDSKTAALVEFLSQTLPCPMAVSHLYGEHTDSPLCIPPIPPSEPPEAYLSQWKHRPLWLELSAEAEEITVTEEGSAVTSLPFSEAKSTDFYAEPLLCHYRQEIREDAVVFTLYRAGEDQRALLETINAQGITTTLGLYQEFFAISV